MPQPSLQRSHSPHSSQKCTLGDWDDGASAKPTICRRLEINDRPKPSGSQSRSAASIAAAVTGLPNLPFSLKSMCETPASHSVVCLGESGFGRRSTALYSGERAGGTVWWSQLSPHWLQRPTWSAGELILEVDTNRTLQKLSFIWLKVYWWSTNRKTIRYNELEVIQAVCSLYFNTSIPVLHISNVCGVWNKKICS